MLERWSYFKDLVAQWAGKLMLNEAFILQAHVEVAVRPSPSASMPPDNLPVSHPNVRC
jgi:hypothetical protein